MWNNRVICIHGCDERTFHPLRLKKYLRTIQKLGYKFVTLDDILLQNSSKRWSICLTVDDAYKNCITNLLPILQDLNIIATLFVPTGWLGLKSGNPILEENAAYPKEDVMTAEDLLYWASQGQQIGFHTHNHINLYNHKESFIEEDFNKGMRLLKEIGIKTSYFAYPRGFLPQKRNNFEKLLYDNQILYAFTVFWGNINKGEPYYINRVCIGDKEPLWWSLLKTVGLVDWYHKRYKVIKEQRK
ncbi:polysaccharide deacetylase family protein [Parabacteroides pacaensis]|uniref:polysaccharide deacetylase family protein n=1 Tax=Parabacteroides pacaensis TaxID=2086575 RepID=UPI000D0FD6FA|nr:polysaccharide deacetylase family protein [Parabacteroides pacaensis]